MSQIEFAETTTGAHVDPVQVARRWYADKYICDRESVLSGKEDYRPYLSGAIEGARAMQAEVGGAVRVKPLVWENGHAECVFGGYWYFPLQGRIAVQGTFGTVALVTTPEEAGAAANADHSQRIRPFLEAAPAQEGADADVTMRGDGVAVYPDGREWSPAHGSLEGLLKRLRAGVTFYDDSIKRHVDPTELCDAAADAIAALQQQIEYWRKDSAAAWDKCEERRLEGEKAEARATAAEAECDALRDQLFIFKDGYLASREYTQLSYEEDAALPDEKQALQRQMSKVRMRIEKASALAAGGGE